MISSTSITSISGVVLMSTITSGSPPPPLPTFIAMKFSLLRHDAYRRFGDEADLEYAGALAVEHYPADEFVAGVSVAADMHLGLGLFHRNFLEPGQQFFVVDKLVV